MARVDKLKVGSIIFDRKLDISYLIREITSEGFNIEYGNRDRSKIAGETSSVKREFFTPINNNRRFKVFNP